MQPSTSQVRGSIKNDDTTSKPMTQSEARSMLLSHVKPHLQTFVPWQQFVESSNPNADSYLGRGRLENISERNIPDPQPSTVLYGYKGASVVTRDFKERVRAGEIIVNPHKVWRSQIDITPGFRVVEATNTTWTYGWYGLQRGKRTINWLAEYRRVKARYEVPVEYFDVSDPKSAWAKPFYEQFKIDKEVVNAAVGEADALVFDLLTTLAELPETLKWLADLLRQAAEATKAARKKEVEVKKLLLKKGRTAKQIAQAVASVWMQYRYAIMPLSYSIEDVLKALESWKRTYGKVSEKYVETYTQDDIRNRFGFSTNNLTLSVSEAQTVHRCSIKRGYDPRGLVDALLQVLKLNPVTTAWELIPLSFVVDWFINIGEVLSIATAPTFHFQEGATYSWKTTVNFTLTHTETGASLVYKHEAYERRVINPYAEYGLTIGWDMNWMRYLDSLALLLNPTLKILKNTQSR